MNKCSSDLLDYGIVIFFHFGGLCYYDATVDEYVERLLGDVMITMSVLILAPQCVSHSNIVTS